MEWSFVLEALHILRTPQHIIDVIQHCLESASMSINWQGIPTQSFLPSRRLRQGDPLSPLLFVIALDRLSHCIMDAVNNGD